MSKRIIYVRTPKTAGTSVDEVLRQRFESPIQIDGKTKHWPSQAQLEERDLIILGDIVARRFRQQFHLIWSEASSFAIVRNPYDKLVSAWKYCRSTRDKSLRDALSTHLPRETAGETYNHDYVHFSMKQKDFIVEDNALIVDSLIRFETLQEDLGQFFRRHGLDPPHLPHRNRTPSRDGSVPKLTPEVLALIEDRFGADFDFFGYDRNLPSKFQP